MKRVVLFGLSLLSVTSQLSAQQPGGIKSPVVWFSTEAVEENQRNGNYKWEDRTGNNLQLKNITDKSEVIVPRNSIHTYNFNPALPFDSTINAEIDVPGTDLSQKTVVAVVGAKSDEGKNNTFLYQLRGRKGEERLFSKTRVIHTTNVGKTAYDYNPNLLMNDSSVRVKLVSYLEALQPNISLLSRIQTSKINIGGKFSEAISPENSTYNEEDLSDMGSSRFYCPEMVVYSRFLRKGEREQVESYMALKYGITLDIDYLNGYGKVIWKNDNQYKYRVVGYGNDSCSGFNQTESTTAYEENAYHVDDTYHKGDSENRSSAHNLIVMGLSDGEEFDKDAYVIFADNGGLTSVSEIKDKLDSVDYTDTLKVMQRIWKVVNNGVDSTIYHRLELGYKMTADSDFERYRNNNIYMLIDRSGGNSFGGNVDTVRMDTIDKERAKIIFEGIQLDSINYFTFAYAGIPIEDPEDNTYDYVLELENPTCTEFDNQTNNDGSIKLHLPENEGGFYYVLEDLNNSSAMQVAHDSIYKENLSANTYLLKVLPVGSNSIEFKGSGISYINMMFNNNGGAMRWRVANAQTESKVAFIYDHVNTLHPGDDIFIHGVRISDGKLYKISAGVVDQDPLCDVKDSSVILLERYVNTQDGWGLYARCFVDGIMVFDNINMGHNNYKVGFKTDNGNVANFELINDFNWNGSYPDVFFNKYQNPPTFINGEGVYAGINGFESYWLDLNVNCQKEIFVEEQTMNISTDLDNRTFTVYLTLNQPGEVVFEVFDISGSSHTYETITTTASSISKTFQSRKSSEYFIRVIAPDGSVFEGQTILP